MTAKRAGLMLIVVGLLGVGCGSDGGGGATGEKRKPSVAIRQPKDGETAECPVTLRVRGRRVVLLGKEAPANDKEDKKDRLVARVHGFIDREAPAAGAVIPKADGSGIVDFDRGRASLTNLTPGQHKVVVVAASADRKVLAPVLSDVVTFVAPAC